MSPRPNRPGSRVKWIGAAVVLGSLLWTATSWVRAAVLGDRPYVATAFDALSLIGWASMAAALIGFRLTFYLSDHRIGRVGVGLTGLGMLLVGSLLSRSLATFIRAGFGAVPPSEEDPAGLVLSLATVAGLGATLLGTGALGVALRD